MAETRSYNYLSGPVAERAEACMVARQVLEGRGIAKGPLAPGSVSAPDTVDVVNIASYITTGEDPWTEVKEKFEGQYPDPAEEQKTQPPYPFREGTVLVLGPETIMSEDKDVIAHKGVNYYANLDKPQNSPGDNEEKMPF